MTAGRGLALAIGAAVVIALAWSWFPRSDRPLVDLTQALSTAKRQPSPSAFVVEPVTIDGDTKPSILAREQTRLTYHVTVPKHARLRVAAAIHPSVWNEAGDGVLLLVGI